MPGRTAESLEEGMQVIMRAAMHKETNRTVLLDDDPAIIETEYAGKVVTAATDEGKAVVESQPP